MDRGGVLDVGVLDRGILEGGGVLDRGSTLESGIFDGGGVLDGRWSGGVGKAESSMVWRFLGVFGRYLLTILL